MFVLAIPWILIALFLFSIVSFFFRKWKAGLFFFTTCLSLNWYYECIPFRLWSVCGQSDKGTTLKVMSFNINGAYKDIGTRAERIVRIINEKNPDIIFLAEFYEEDLNVLDTLLSKTLPYSTCVGGFYHYFYSKYPLGLMTRLNSSSNGSGVFKCRVALFNDSISLYGCHLASNNYSEKEKYMTPDSIKNLSDIKAYIKNIERASLLRSIEANALVNDLSDDYPVLVMGDFNDVGGSKAIRTLESAGLKDAWWEGGFGYGATIHKTLSYRIDHILFSEKMKLQKIEVVSSKGLSDHEALYAEFSM